jgi:hypothetical protein
MLQKHCSGNSLLVLDLTANHAEDAPDWIKSRLRPSSLGPKKYLNDAIEMRVKLIAGHLQSPSAVSPSSILVWTYLFRQLNIAL